MSDNDRLRRALFEPAGVALVGASADPKKNTGRPQRYLAAHGYAGHVHPINPGRAEVQGRKAYVSADAIDAGKDGPVDHAFVMVPADAVPDAVRACGKAGIPLATIYSDGFAETGEAGRAKQAELLEIAKAAGVRLLGPNSMGVICPASRLTLSVNAVLEMPEMPTGRFGLVSQSGTILGTLLSRGAARGIGFSRMISVGNESDLGVGELVDLLVDDPETDAILLFLEAIRDAPALAAAARRAFEAGKPVIAYKLGRSAVGRAVALSHSGALAGEDAAVDAFFRANGIVRVETLEGLFEMPPLLIGKRPAKGRRVAVMTTTGGGAATVVDRLGAAGLELVPAPERLHARLKDFDLKIGRGPIVDLTMAGTRDGIYGAALAELLAGDDCDAVVCVVGSSAQFHPDLAVKPIVEKATGAAKPVAGFMVPEAGASLRLLADAGIAAFRTPEACADAMRAFFDWRAPADAGTSGFANIEAAAGVLERHVGEKFDEAMSLELFAALGVPVAAHAVVASESKSPVPYPVAVKALSAALPHKTEAGAVRLNIADEKALAAAVTEIAANVKRYKPGLALDRFLVQSMAKGVGEALVGFRVDPQIGPVVVLAPGGILAELYGDSAIRSAPVDKATALAMIDEVTGLAPLRGYRNLPKGDLDALADAIQRLSDLARLGRPPLEAEINPMIVMGEGKGVVAVDGLVVTEERE